MHGGDWQLAWELFDKLASMGNPIGFNYLGVMSECGQGRPCNVSSAEMYYRRAIEIGGVRYGANLASMLRDIGRIEDAIDLFKQLVEHGVDGARLDLVKLTIHREGSSAANGCISQLEVMTKSSSLSEDEINECALWLARFRSTLQERQ